jgi:hypothetical protein
MRVQDLPQVSKQSHLGTAGVGGQVPEKGRAHVRIKTRISEDLPDQQRQLKLQKVADRWRQLSKCHGIAFRLRWPLRPAPVIQ